MSDIKMNFGEDLELDSNQVVIGVDTGRVVAEFSHHAEAQSFVNFYNKQQAQQAEITRLNYLVASQKETMEIMQDIIDTEQLKGVE